MRTESAPAAAENSGVLRHHIWEFYNTLRSTADETVSAAAELTGFAAKGSQRLGWGQMVGPGKHEAERNDRYSPRVGGSSIPEESLVNAAATKLRVLLDRRRNPVLGSGGHVFSPAESQEMEHINTLMRVITWYCWAAIPATENSFDFISLISADRQVGPKLQRMGRRNAAAGDSLSSSGPHLSEDVQMAERIFGVGVEAVVRFSVYDAWYRAVGHHDAGRNESCEQHDSYKPYHAARASALYLLTASFMRFRKSPFNVSRYLSMLFPEVDAQDAQTSHPLLTPLLWDEQVQIRAAAGALLSALLRKLSGSFAYAEEAHQERQSFISLASLSGRTLVSTHVVLTWALQRVEGHGGDQGASHRFFVQTPDTGIYFSVFSMLVTVTPYHRCPRCRELLGDVLRMRVLRESLVADDNGTFKSAAAFLCEVLKSESLITVVRENITGGETTATTESEKSGVCSKDETFNRGRGTLVESLLTHAATRVEIWKCVVQLARLHPVTVGSYFPRLLAASRGLLPGTAATNGAELSAGVIADAIVGECLRGWVHFMGYVWQSFDGHSADPALRQDYAADRATHVQREQIMTEIVLPVLRMTARDSRHTEAKRAALRCVAQVGDGYLLSLSDSAREDIVKHVVAATYATDGSGRAEALTTIGVWAWQYTAFDSKALNFVERAAACLLDDHCGVVRVKAAFALSNITSRLVGNLVESDADEWTGHRSADGSIVRQSPHHIQLLCEVALHAAQRGDDPAVVGHGIRIMSHLLGCLTFEELIAELSVECDEQRQVVAEAFLGALLQFLHHYSYDAKLRWNTACALGFGLSREVVFDAEPKGATSAVERLCSVVCSDRNFKVRTQAATALSRVPPSCLVAGRYTTLDLTPVVARALCSALRDVIGDTTETYNQYREQDALRVALRQGLNVMVTGATPSAELQLVFAEFRVILLAEGLLG